MATRNMRVRIDSEPQNFMIQLIDSNDSITKFPEFSPMPSDLSDDDDYSYLELSESHPLHDPNTLSPKSANSNRRGSYIDDKMMAEFKEIFSAMDLDGNGSISRTEFRHSFETRSSLTPRDVKEILKTANTNHKDEIEWSEFVSILQEDMGVDIRNMLNEQEIKKAFDDADKDFDGLITPPDLIYLMQTLDEVISMEDAEDMVQSADSMGKGSLNFEEFKQMVLSAE